ncbi:secreted protein [Nonlabens sp. YIK11]|uniref:hypothetical protein n=1 Tax=Nonlabens sp. YIK11 TaxID=1453349 RepID=UPI0006DCB29A|nr:hypothetical protein [Nonlabens sp. YIK11]KQC31906.1 secreted protein [Nonlabens sp. YIK11]
MKKKSILLVAIAVFSFAFAKAQEADDCTVMLQIFAENAKARSYDEAYKQLAPLVTNCPDASAAIYQYGERIYEHRLRNNIGTENENAVGLIAMFDGQINRFADKINVSKKMVEKARAMYKYNIGTQDEVYAILDKEFRDNPEEFTDPNAMITYFKLAENRYNDQKIDLQGFFDIYDELTLQIENVQDERGMILNNYLDKEAAGTLTDDELSDKEAQETNIKNYGIVMGSVNATLGSLADCDKLIPLYEAEFDNKKSDEKWLSNVLRRLQAKECTDAPLYIASVKALHEIKPSANTAYGLGNIASSQAEKFKYWDQAISLGVSKDLESRIHYKKGVAYKDQGQYSSAKREFIAANNAKPSFGAPFLQIANMIASSANSCGNTIFEKRAINWVAARYANKAAAVDPSIKSNAAQAAASYNGRAPQKQDIFMENMSGKTITFSCWVGESVRVP